jgi:hypothetical protein
MRGEVSIPHRFNSHKVSSSDMFQSLTGSIHTAGGSLPSIVSIPHRFNSHIDTVTVYAKLVSIPHRFNSHKRKVRRNIEYMRFNPSQVQFTQINSVSQLAKKVSIPHRFNSHS